MELGSDYLSGGISLSSEQFLKEQLQIAKRQYDNRVEALTQSISQLFDDVNADDTINAMKSDPISAPFVQARIAEMTGDSLLREKEAIISQLSEQLIAGQGNESRASGELLRMTEHCQMLTASLSQSEAQCELYKRQLAEEVSCMRVQFDSRLKETQNNILEKSRPALEESQNKAQELARALQSRESTFNELAADWQKTLGDMEVENGELRNQLNSTKSKLQYHTQITDRLQWDQNDLAEKLKTTYKTKSQRFKRKIQEQRGKIDQMSQELINTRSQLEESRSANDAHMSRIHEDLRHVRDEWERKCSELQQESQKRESDLISRHESQIESLQTQYQKLLDERINDIQNGMASQYNRTKTHDVELATKIQELEKDYILITTHGASIQKLEETYETQMRKLRSEVHDATEQIRSLEAEKGFLTAENTKFLREYKVQLADAKACGATESISEYSSLKSENKELLEKSEKLTIEVDTHKIAAYASQKELENLKSEVQQSKNKLLESQSVQQEIQTAAQELSRKTTESTGQYETEHKNHLQTKNRLSNVEQQLIQVQQECKVAEDLAKELQSQNSSLKGNAEELQKLRLSQLAQHRKLKSQFSSHIALLKSEKTSIKNGLSLDLQVLKKDCQKIVQDIMLRFIDNVNDVRKRYEEQLSDQTEKITYEWSNKVSAAESVAQSAAQTQRELQKSTEVFQASSEAMKFAQESTQDEVARIKILHGEAQATITQLKAENSTLQKHIATTAQAFDKLQEDVSMEAIRIQNDKDQCIVSTKLSVEKQYQQQLESLSKEIALLKVDHDAKLQAMTDEVGLLQHRHASELEAIKYTSEKQIKTMQTELSVERDVSRKLKDGLLQLDKQTSGLQNEHGSTIREYKDKILQMKDRMTQEHDLYVNYKKKKNKKIEKLTAELRNSTKELALKNELIEEMQHELDRGQRSQRQLKDEGFSNRENQSDASSKNKSDVDYENIKQILTKSYHQSIEQVKKAKMLDKETKQLSKSVRRPEDNKSNI